MLGRLRPQRPVGTMGGVGWMRGPCACPGWGGLAMHIVEPQRNHHPTRTSTRPLPISASAPCPYRMEGDRFVSLPHLVVKNHQDTGDASPLNYQRIPAKGLSI